MYIIPIFFSIVNHKTKLEVNLTFTQVATMLELINIRIVRLREGISLS